jgi:hypothetical protein
MPFVSLPGSPEDPDISARQRFQANLRWRSSRPLYNPVEITWLFETCDEKENAFSANI